MSLVNSYVKKNFSLMNDAKMTTFWILQCYYHVITIPCFINSNLRNPLKFQFFYMNYSKTPVMQDCFNVFLYL